jgi:tetratricopeptide (TPR) repeat protein
VIEEQLDPTSGMFDASTQDQYPSGVVTLHQLSHRVPGKALKEFESALKVQAKEEHENAVGHLKKAIEIDPEFCAARNLRKALGDFPQASLLLACVLAGRGETESAEDQLQRYLARGGDRNGVDLANQWMRQLDLVGRR